MMYLVDTVTVAPGKLEEYLGVLRTQAVPLYRAAGATLEHCRATTADLGEPAEVQLTWSFADYSAWNEIRRALITDGRYYQSAAALAALRTGGQRRFHHDVPDVGPSAR